MHDGRSGEDGGKSHIMDKYQSEIEDFQRNFSRFKDKKIALYGIGRMTVTILQSMSDYHFVGLLDRDEGRIGTCVCGVPIISPRKAEEEADLIIINTSATYWEMIYGRISNYDIPVYYKDGTRAEGKAPDETDAPFWEERDDIRTEIDKADVVAFDFYDTLFSRRTLFPSDVFSMMECLIDKRHGVVSDYLSKRKAAVSRLEENYGIHELYEEMRGQADFGGAICDELLEMELRLEKKLLGRRNDVLEHLRYAIGQGKDVYIVSDMYLPGRFFEGILRAEGCDLPETHIIISNEYGKKKSDGLWSDFQKGIKKSEKVLCIGDSYESDVSKAKESGFSARWVPGPFQLLQWSSARGIVPKIKSAEASAIMGLVSAKLFQNPFSLNESEGRILVRDPVDAGYCIYGPIVLEFIRWLTWEAEKDDVTRLLFFARDGYFLVEDFELFRDLTGGVLPKSEYVAISRQLAMISQISDKDGLKEYIRMPYSGTVRELMEDRLHYTSEELNFETMDELFEMLDSNQDFLKDVMAYVDATRKNYLEYLRHIDINVGDAVVDLGYHGNNQRCLNGLLGMDVKGYYINADLSDSNPNTGKQGMKACFQSNKDKRASSSNLYRKVLYLESFLTAPYGMVEAVGEEGDFITKPNGKNQDFFDVKQKMNKGVKEFICDYIDLFYECEFGLDTEIVDSWYGVCFTGGIDLSGEIKRSYWNDNAFMHRFENNLFE